MSDVLGYAVRSCVILLVAVAVLPAFRRSSASLRHALLCAALAAAVLVAPIGHATPWTMSVPLPGETTEAIAVPPADGAAVPTISTAGPRAVSAGHADAAPLTLLVAIWLAGFAWLSARRIGALLDLRRAASSARPLVGSSWATVAAELARVMGLGRPVRLLVTDRPGLLATWGLIVPRLTVPTHAIGWEEARIRAVLAHELEHVRRRDWLVQLAADVVRDANWWNPLFWWTSRRLRLESERACDDAVLRAGMPGRDYAGHLVDIARACGPRARVSSAVAMARHSNLHRRIDAMLNPRLSRTALSRPLVALAVVAALAIAVSVAGLRAQDTSPRPLTGVLYDPDGAVLPGVEVTLADEHAARSTSRTDAQGRFTFASVPAGTYELRVALPGFKALIQRAELRQQKDWSRALVMRVGDVQESVSVRSARLGNTTPAVQPEKVRVGGNIRPPMKTKDVKPTYPEAMRSAGEEGTVLLDTVIATDGSVQSIRVVPSPVHRALVDAAVAAVREWRFAPTLLNGSPVEVVMRVSVDFTLEG